MPITIQAELPPLRIDVGGAVRVGPTRVLFVLVVRAFKDGNTPEQIVEMYDTLDLADAYGAIAYYLRHRTEVEEYLAEYDREAERIRREIEERQRGMPNMRAILLARLAARQAAEGDTPHIVEG